LASTGAAAFDADALAGSGFGSGVLAVSDFGTGFDSGTA